MKPKNILITGVAGFIGSNLAERLLTEGHKVIGIDNLAYGVKEQIPQGVEFHKLDIQSSEIFSLFNNVDMVYHLAAKNCIADCQNDPLETAQINVVGSVNVFEAARRADVKKVVYAESSALYEGSRVHPTPETEVRPESFYAQSKASSMAFADAYRRFYKLNLTALRYFCVYGPRQDYRRTIPPVMSAFIIKLLRKECPTIYGDGTKRRDFVYVDDVNEFHLLCLNDARTDEQTYNIGSGNNYSVLEIFNLIENILQTGVKPQFNPDLPGEAQITLADTTRAQHLGWTAKTPISNGLKNMIQYIKINVMPELSLNKNHSLV